MASVPSGRLAVALATILISLACAHADGPYSGNLGQDTTWTLAESPYTIDHMLSAPNDITLTIEPGVTVLLVDDAKITIYGRLVAEDAMIRFTREPDGEYWGSIKFDHSMANNHIS